MSDPATVWLAIPGMALVTWLARASFLLLPERIELPLPARRALRYVPAAVLTAIVAPELALIGGGLALDPGNEKLLAGLAAIALSLWLRATFAVILGGLAALHLFAVLW